MSTHKSLRLKLLLVYFVTVMRKVMITDSNLITQTVRLKWDSQGLLWIKVNARNERKLVKMKEGPSCLKTMLS